MSQYQSEQNYPVNESVRGSAVPGEGEKAGRLSLILGIVGLFILGIVLGPLAIMQAKKAERLGTKATAGMVLGWLDTIFGVIGIVVLISRYM